MGESRNVAELTRKLNTTADNFRHLNRAQLQPVAQAMTVPMLRAAASAGLRPGSRIGGNGAKTKPWAGTYIKATGAQDLSVGYAKGAVLVDQKTRAHIIRPRKAGSSKNQDRYRRRTGQVKKSIAGIAFGSILAGLTGVEQEGIGGGYKGRHGLNIAGKNWRAYAKHPGTRGKHFFDRSKGPTQKAASVAMQRQQALIIGRTFK